MIMGLWVVRWSGMLALRSLSCIIVPKRHWLVPFGLNRALYVARILLKCCRTGVGSSKTALLWRIRHTPINIFKEFEQHNPEGSIWKNWNPSLIAWSWYFLKIKILILITKWEFKSLELSRIESGILVLPGICTNIHTILHFSTNLTCFITLAHQ